MKKFSRRDFISTGLAVSAIATLKPNLLFANTAFSLPALNYKLNELEPFIDAETMDLHYNKHHQAYIDKVNQEIQKQPELASLSLEELNAKALSLSDLIRNNAGGHYNHSFFWKIMTPASKTGSPAAQIKMQIERDFGSIENMQKAVNDAAAQRFGSGWAWLVKTQQGNLVACSTANQDNPLMKSMPVTGKPILAIDVWEHAYYLKYRNKRADYLKNWWSVLNWEEVNKNFISA